MQSTDHIVIIGGVAGGAACASRLRRLNEHVKITVFERGQYISYANCGLPYYIGGVIQERDVLLQMTPQGFKTRYNVDVKINQEVTAIHKDTKQITVLDQITKETITVHYDKLVLAVGSNPIVPPTPGIQNPKIFTLRTINDSQNILDFCVQTQAKSAIIVGGGFIGLEMAENLHHRGIKITIIEKYIHIMKIIDQEMAAMLQQHLKLKGVQLILENSVVEFSEIGTKVGAKLEDGRILETDFVIFSIGVLADLTLAKGAGLKTGRGICTNTQMQTSDPNIFAVGDAAEVTDLVGGSQCCIPLAGPATKQARVVADVISGKDSKYEGSIGTGVARVKVFDLTVGCVGNNEGLLKMQKIPFRSCIVHGMSHAGYFPKAYPITIKILFQESGKILGGQVIGAEGVDKRNDLLATAIRFGLTVYDLQKMELSYAPPFGSVKDPINAVGFVASNMLKGEYQVINWNQLEKYQKEGALLLDVRSESEFKKGAIPGSTLLSLPDLRGKLDTLPKDKNIIVICKIGLRGYLAQRIMLQNGFTSVFSLDGGFKTWISATFKQTNPKVFEEQFAPTLKHFQDNIYETLQSEYIDWDPDFAEFIPKM